MVMNTVAGLLARLQEEEPDMPFVVALPGGGHGRPAMLEIRKGRVVMHVNVLPED